MGRFRIQTLLEYKTWYTQKTKPKHSQYGNSSTDWTLLNLDFTVENYGKNLVFDQIELSHSDMCYWIVTKTHSV